RACLDDPDEQQRLRRVGRDLWRRGDGGGADRPPRPPLSHRQHPRQQLSPPSARRTGAATPCRSTPDLRTTVTPSGDHPNRLRARPPPPVPFSSGGRVPFSTGVDTCEPR